MALAIKFMANYLFNPVELPPVPTMKDDPVDDVFLADQGPLGGLGKIRFADYKEAYDTVDTPNVRIFLEQIELFKELLMKAGPDEKQQKNIDFMLVVGEIFILVPYGQLIIENLKTFDVDDEVLDQIFDFMVRDVSKYAVQLYGKEDSTEAQMKLCLKMIRKSDVNPERFARVWEKHVFSLNGAYEMNP